MRAIAFDDFGSPPTLHDLSVPAPGVDGSSSQTGIRRPARA